jgi:pimeloyl-ACP methyl ester carboxylesterase
MKKIIIVCAILCIAAARIASADSGSITSPMLLNQLDNSGQSNGSWYSDNWYQLGRGFAGTITAMTFKGSVDGFFFAASHLWLNEFSDPNYQHLTNTYSISDGAPFIYQQFTTAVFSGLSIPIDGDRYYRLDTRQDRQNTSVILQGTNGFGIAMANNFRPGIGRIEGEYPFYPYISINGNFPEPLVIVPGVMGTRLVDNATGKEYWPDVTDMVNSGDDSYLDVLKLAPDGTQIPGREMTATDVIRTATGTYDRLLIPIPLEESAYANTIKAFTDIGYDEGKNLFVVPYDWRLSIASSAVTIGAALQDARSHSPDGKIDVIAHSMGGLAVKAYLSSLQDDSFVDKLVFSGAPQLGAPFIFKALQYGDNLGFSFGPFDLLNPNEAKSIMQNMPGVYDLLPSRRFVGVDGSYLARESIDDAGNVSTKALNFDEAKNFMAANSDDARNTGLLASADAFHGSADNVPLSGVPHVYNVVGCQNPTPEQYVIHDDGSVDVAMANGDGSVPVDSAMNLADGYQNYFILHSEDGVDHQGLIRDPQTLALMQAIMQGTVSTLALEPLGISTFVEDCIQGRGAPRPAVITVNVSGSSTVDVYDNAGDHVGPNSAGDIDLQIPGSSYDTFGGTTLVSLPAPAGTASGTYKISIKKPASKAAGSASKKTNVKITTYDTSATGIASTTYTNIPLFAASSTATLSLSGTQPTGTNVSTVSAVLTVGTGGPASTGTSSAGTVDAASSTVISPDNGGTSGHVPLACIKR